jgi:hypothetical protein
MLALFAQSVMAARRCHNLGVPVGPEKTIATLEGQDLLLTGQRCGHGPANKERRNGVKRVTPYLVYVLMSV